MKKCWKIFLTKYFKKSKKLFNFFRIERRYVKIMMIFADLSLTDHNNQCYQLSAFTFLKQPSRQPDYL